MARHLGDDWLIPALDESNESWFTAGKITAQSCDSCGAFQHPPEDVCGGCQGTSLSVKECSGEGTVESVAVVHHPVHPGLSEHCPYAIVVVSLDGAPGVNAIGNILNRAPADVAIGQKVRAVFEPAKDPETGADLLIPQWETV
jgi:uncharacterized OB-fold protein